MGREIPTKSSHRRQVIQRINISGNQHCRTCLNPGRLWRFERQDPVHALVVEVDAGAATGLAISIRYGTSPFDAAIKKSIRLGISTLALFGRHPYRAPATSAGSLVAQGQEKAMRWMRPRGPSSIFSNRLGLKLLDKIVPLKAAL